MDPVTVAFLVGPLLAPIVLVLALTQICVLGWRNTGAPLLAVAVVEAALVAAYWVVWWFGVDWVDGEPIPNALFDATTP